MLNGLMADNCVFCSSLEDGVQREERLLRRRSGDRVSSYLHNAYIDIMPLPFDCQDHLYGVL
jgi:hypothetical protein